ncbi:Transcription intermediary factor 1-beta [Holothuria leucospilota]|uniref:Transcription intermediary factor 1-beta n=1 Tax=Holothuria leucospilota TaxID=206669 RepID=A0A9Q1C555_HOLLE|nr:Transcription intermediary factor 1-beta [Holothuria leucospilota]
MRNLVEYVQIQQSLQSDETRECYSCSKHLKAAAYCFKCNNFLCTDCLDVHLTHKTLNDHKQHTLSVEDIESKNITLKKLASMRDTPRCHIHPSKVSELCCKTCTNVPVCMACMLGKHKGHDLHEVTELARVKREMLDEQLKILGRMRGERKVMAPKKIKEKLIQNVTKEKEIMQTYYENKFHKEEIKLGDIKRKLEDIQRWKKNEKQKIFDSLQSEMEKEIAKVKSKYEDKYKLMEKEINNGCCAREIILEKKLDKFSQKLEQLNKDKSGALASIEMQSNENVQTIEGICERFEKENERFENLSVIASSIVASEDDWTAVQCIPSLCDAATNLVNDLKKEFPDLEKITNVQIDYQLSSKERLSISKKVKQLERRFTLNDNMAYHYINCATGSGDGNIVITGSPLTGNEAFLIVTNVSGEIMKQTKLIAGMRGARHACDLMSQRKVAFGYTPNTIGVYNIRNCSYFRKVISDVISSWPLNRNLSCIASDPVNNHILVGGKESRDVYVFDDQLNYIHSLTLPEMIRWPQDITVSDGNLLVCDYDGKKAYVTTMEDLESKIVREFIKPDVEADDLRPYSVCADEDDFVYMLWTVPFGAQCFLVQYSPERSQLLTTRKVDENVRAVAAVETAQGEKLILATQTTQTAYIYSLNDSPNEEC